MRVMVTGHRPQSFTFEEEAFVKRNLHRALSFFKERGLTEAISGMALGADSWWAETALAQEVPLAAYIPFEGQALRWSAGQQAHWRELRAAASREIVVSPTPGVRALFARNGAMLRDADAAVVCLKLSSTKGGTKHCYEQLLKREIPHILIDVEAHRIRGRWLETMEG